MLQYTLSDFQLTSVLSAIFSMVCALYSQQYRCQQDELAVLMPCTADFSISRIAGLYGVVFDLYVFEYKQKTKPVYI